MTREDANTQLDALKAGLIEMDESQITQCLMATGDLQTLTKLSNDQWLNGRWFKAGDIVSARYYYGFDD